MNVRSQNSDLLALINSIGLLLNFSGNGMNGNAFGGGMGGNMAHHGQHQGGYMNNRSHSHNRQGPRPQFAGQPTNNFGQQRRFDNRQQRGGSVQPNNYYQQRQQHYQHQHNNQMQQQMGANVQPMH